MANHLLSIANTFTWMHSSLLPGFSGYVWGKGMIATVLLFPSPFSFVRQSYYFFCYVNAEVNYSPWVLISVLKLKW